MLLIEQALASLGLALLARKLTGRWVARGVAPWACELCMGAWAALLATSITMGPWNVDGLPWRAVRWLAVVPISFAGMVVLRRLEGPPPPPPVFPT